MFGILLLRFVDVLTISMNSIKGTQYCSQYWEPTLGNKKHGCRHLVVFNHALRKPFILELHQSPLEINMFINDAQVSCLTHPIKTGISF